LSRSRGARSLDRGQAARGASGRAELLQRRATLRRARLKPSIAIEAASNETIKQAVAAGFGVAFMSARAFVAFLQKDGESLIRRLVPARLRRYWSS
jgi:DNA-binding transcriptional LysR family regulator